MDLLFENQTQTTKKLLEEFSKEAYYAFNKKTRMICLIMLVVETFAFVLRFVSSGFNFSMQLFFLLFLAGFFLFFYFKGYIFKLQENLKILESIHGELPHAINKFYEVNIETITDHSNLTFEYNKITNVLETENLFIIMIGKQGVYLSKKGFTVGNFSDFKNFIENKMNSKN